MPPRNAELLRSLRTPPHDSTTEGFGWLETLWATIAERAATRPTGSYTAKLLAGGVDTAARKVTEEATEVLMAAKDDAAGRPRAACGTRGRVGRPSLSPARAARRARRVPLDRPRRAAPPPRRVTARRATRAEHMANGLVGYDRRSVERCGGRRGVRWTFSMAFGSVVSTTAVWSHGPSGASRTEFRCSESQARPGRASRSAPTESRGWNETPGADH